MVRELDTIDISEMPDLLRIAEEVRATGQPRLLRRDGDDVALVTPVEAALPAKRRPSRRRGKATSAADSLWNIVGIAGRSDGPDDVTDVSSDKYTYLAEAYATTLE